MDFDLVPLRAGPLALWFQSEDGMLRHVCAGGREVVRGITAPVRDRTWGTVPVHLENLRIDARDDGFGVAFDAFCHAPGIDYRWQGEITGDSQGRVIYRFSGEAFSDFERNRIGFCVLHPPEAASCPVLVEHVDGRRMRAHLPGPISPHQPFRELRALTVEHPPGVFVSVRMEGDHFEMEDQRNWLDASFKTYCTPLDLPRPVWVRTGERVEQRVTLTLLEPQGLAWAGPHAPPSPTLPSRPSGAARLPLGLGLAWPMDDRTELDDDEAARLRSLALAHLRIDVFADDDASLAAAETGIRAARAASLPLEVALHLDERSLAAAARWVAALAAPVTRWIVVARGRPALTDAALPRALREWIGPAGAPIVGGSDAHFTELNRHRPPSGGLDGVSFGFNPQVHAFDPRSIRETLSMIPPVVSQARSFLANAPTHVGVITFGPAGRSSSGEDPRLGSALGVEWTRGAIAALGIAGATSATFYTVRGVLGAPALAAVFRDAGDDV